MFSITVDVVIPNMGIAILPDNSFTFDSTQNLSVTITLPIVIEDFNNDKGLAINDINTVSPVLSSYPEATEVAFVKQAKNHISKRGLELCPDGVGGTYFIKDETQQTVGIFKPIDEEPGALKNPKNLVDEPLLPPGGGAIREVAAYLLDHQARAGVPPTFLASGVMYENSDEKIGSIQQFVENIGDTTSIGSSKFSVDDVHNIGILDIRLMNMDRNDENLLVAQKDNQTKLVPIDHAYVLPPSLDNVYFAWMYWRQAKQNFSAETLQYIKQLSVEQDEKILRQLGFDEDSIRTMKVATILLQKAASKGMNLFTIASLVSRKKPTQPSQLELLVQKTQDLVQDTHGSQFFIEFEKIVDNFVDDTPAS